MTCKFHEDGTLPARTHWVWVFGSNLSGIHGAGAAAIARTVYGRPLGEHTAIGIYQDVNSSESYAIPTKDQTIRSMSLNAIRPFVYEFIEYVKQHPQKQFFVTRVGCGLAGFSDGQIAPMFTTLKSCDNVSFALAWEPYLHCVDSERTS